MDGKFSLDNAFWDVLSKRNLLLLVGFWGAGLVFVISYGTVLGRFGSDSALPAVVPAGPITHETGTFSAWRRKTDGPSETSYRIIFDNLCAANRALGAFTTASQKRVHIENLHVAFAADAPLAWPESDSDVRLADFCDLFAPRTGIGAAGCPLGVFDEFTAEGQGRPVALDLSNAIEVRVENLDWNISRAAESTLRVQCRYALLRADTSDVTLRGHVTITTPDVVLEGNCMRMDVTEECFVVKGRYRLTRGDVIEKGCGGRFDTTLRPLGVASSKSRENREWANVLLSGRF